MATVPTGRLERELRKLYLRWVSGLPRHEQDMSAYIRKFQQDSERLIQRTGGDIARLGSYLADFPAPKELALDPVVGHVYDQMQQAAIQASIMTGLNSREAARAMLRAGLDKSFRRLERVARTETVRAYWKNQWDSTAGLGLVMVWSAESGPRTCDYCLSRDGLVVEDPSIRDHPNGRCTLLPMHPSRVAYKGTLQPDGSVTMDPEWAGQKVKGAGSVAEDNDLLSGSTSPSQFVQQSASGTPVVTAPIGKVIPSKNGNDYSKAGVRRFPNYASPSSEDWRYISDPEDRMTGLLQYDKAGRRLTEKVARNLDDGLDPFDGIDFAEGKADILNSQYLKRWIDDMLGTEGYDLDDLRTDLVAGAEFLRAGKATQKVLGVPQYRGVNLPKGTDIQSMFSPGKRHTLSYSSATPDRVVADTYAGSAFSGERVVLTIDGARGHELTSVGRVVDDPETILSGEYEVVSIKKDGYGWEVVARWL